MGTITILGIPGKRYQYIVGGNKLKICDFTMPEIRFILSESNFTDEEEFLFNLRMRNIPLEECAEIMNVSNSTIYRINRKIKNKIQKISKV